jgi:carboxyl-terminal processing protease
MFARAPRPNVRSGDPLTLQARTTRGRWTKSLAFLTAFGGGLLVASASQAISKEQSPYAAVGQLARVLVLVENNYVEPVDRERVLRGAIKGMVAELDPHSAYMPPEDFKEFQSETEGSFGGVGIEVDFRTDVIIVVAPIEGSPAARAGIRSGDRIVGVDGKPTRGQSLERIVRTMRGTPGTRVRLTVQRPGVEHPIDFDLVREQVRVTSVVGQRLEGDIAYLRIKQFSSGTHDEFLRAIGRVRGQESGPIAGVVLDMRSNPGGLVEQATALADDLLDRGTIYTTRHRAQVVEDVKAHLGGPFATTPIVVLVNEYTASAAELVAGALQDQKRAVIVGATTFGKGSVQSILELPGGAGLKLTTMLYYTPNGRSIQAQGIVPDVQVATGTSTSSTQAAVRERDIEGHIPQQTQSNADAGSFGTPADAGAGQLSQPGGPNPFEISRDIPKNPANGKDLVLSVGYQILRGVLARAVAPAADIATTERRTP